MDERHRARSLADCRRNALDVSAAHVADREDCRQARFEEMRRAAERPLRGGEIVRRKGGTGLDEAAVVEGETALEPLRGGDRAGHDEDVPHVFDALAAGL